MPADGLMRIGAGLAVVRFDFSVDSFGLTGAGLAFAMAAGDGCVMDSFRKKFLFFGCFF